MATSCPPGLDLTDVDSTALPQNLRTTDPLITALVNYKIGVETLFANFAEMETNLGSVGFHNESDASIAPTKYVIMAINYRNYRELPVSPQELQDAVLIEEMNEFLYKIVEATGVMSTFRYLRQDVEWELFQTNVQMFSENLKELEMAVRTEEAKGIWIRLFGKLGILRAEALKCITKRGALM
ncbi:Protein of unknown function [Pyronema omphalodes CBS 100304]|uniref:Uncharacterized protein n=1 Tax=Pyronema omphalodes (strain CBS 100304) TaxID=1076935 RepID=U4LI00_PYROM|nr:Protein of unknown function [Pyronema omphalodes CBS 100304]